MSYKSLELPLMILLSRTPMNIDLLQLVLPFAGTD